MRLFKLVGFIALFSTQAFAVTLQMTTRNGRDYTLDTLTDRVTTAASEFVICGDQVENIKKVKLWMTEHGHGSTPTVIGPVSEGCRNISKVNFTMPGDWDVRVELSDGDSGAFIVTVDRE